MEVRTDPDPTRETSPIDGRRARRARNREAVVDAMLDLVLEAGGPPSADAVAERAGVSVASLFRYVESLDELRALAVERCQERFADLFELPAGGTLPQRITRFVSRLDARYAQLAPLARLVRARSYDHPGPSELVASVRRADRVRIETLFAPELARLPASLRRVVVDAIAAVTSFESWELLRTTMERSRPQLVDTWAMTVERLLGGDGTSH